MDFLFAAIEQTKPESVGGISEPAGGAESVQAAASATGNEVGERKPKDEEQGNLCVLFC